MFGIYAAYKVNFFVTVFTFGVEVEGFRIWYICKWAFGGNWAHVVCLIAVWAHPHYIIVIVLTTWGCGPPAPRKTSIQNNYHVNLAKTTIPNFIQGNYNIME